MPITETDILIMVVDESMTQKQLAFSIKKKSSKKNSVLLNLLESMCLKTQNLQSQKVPQKLGHLLFWQLFKLGGREIELETALRISDTF